MNSRGKPNRLGDHLSDGDRIRQRVEVLILILSLYCSAIIMLVFCVESARADDETTLDDVAHGSLLLHGETSGRYTSAPLLHTDVVFDISGLIVRAKVRQEFENDGDNWVEGVYAFPLPEDAAVDHMRMQIGTRIIEGQIKEREQAKRVYEQAKHEGKKASLIEQERPNLFTNSVANIGPHERVAVEIEYEQVLRYDAGKFTLRFPMAITARYIPGVPLDRFSGLGWAADTDQVPDASRITPPVRNVGGAVNPISLTMHLNAGFPIGELESPYHAIKREDIDAAKGVALIMLADEQTFADRDFELRWRPMSGQAPKAALFREQIGGDFYYLLMVLPPQGGAHTESEAGQTLAREVIYIIDTSGSMAGTSIRQAKHALLLALTRLRPGDRFNIISFNSTTDQLFGDAVPAYGYNLERARDYIHGLTASGGTEMQPALAAALKQQRESGSVRQIIFLTDGSVGNEAGLFNLIRQRLGDSRLFTVGIGSAPNSHFMSKAAEFGRGSFTYIGDVNQVQVQMASLFNKLETPLMGDLRIDSGNAVTETYPQRLPDLYSSEPLVVAFKTDANNRQLLLSGRREKQNWRTALQLDRAAVGKGIGGLWARRKIGALMDAQYTGAPPEETKRQILNVALQHHLVSKYTSLVAVDITPSRPNGEGLDQRTLPVNLPHGQVFEKIFGHHAQTATSAPLNFTLGMSLLVAAFFLKRGTAA